MPIEITMPRLSDTMESGTVIKWTVKEGDEVSAGDAIADIETDKATMEMQVYDDGKLAKILVKEGEKVNVGEVIAVLAGEDEDPEDVAEKAGAGKDEAPEEKTKKQLKDQELKEKERVGGPEPARAEPRAETDARRGTENGAEEGDGRLRISPVARRLADEHGIDAREIDGSGPHGRVIKRDVLAAIEGEGAPAQAVTKRSAVADRAPVTPAPAPPPAPARLEPGAKPLSNMRQTIARRLVESATTIPHYYVTVTFNMDPLLSLRETLNEQLGAQGVKLSVNDFLVRACALAIHQYPEFNGEWGEDKIVIKEDINIGVAVALPRERGGGLVVAVIRNADRKGLRAISEETRTLAEKARSRGLTLEEMQGSTFTISNLGMFGVEHFTAIINPPNSAILAVSAALEKPVVREGRLMVGREMQVTLSNDHRIIDGATAAQYLQTLKQFIENPATLLV